MSETWEACGLGICAANAGHEGTCAEVSGWDDEPILSAESTKRIEDRTQENLRRILKQMPRDQATTKESN